MRESALLIQRLDVYVTELDRAAFALQADPAGCYSRSGSFVLEHAIDITANRALVAMDIVLVPLAGSFFTALLFLGCHHELLLDVLHVFAVNGYSRTAYQDEVSGIACL